MLKISICTMMMILNLAKADPIQGLVEQITGMRAELEASNLEIEAITKEQQTQIDLWTQKKTELLAALHKEQLRRMQLTEKIKIRKNHVDQKNQANPKATHDFIAWISEAEAWVRRSIPFRTEQRIQILENLKARSQGGLESAESLAAELWQFYEQELKMGGDNEFRIIDVQTENGVQKAQVVRLGLFAMVAATPDGHIRKAVRKNSQWSLEPVSGYERDDFARMIKNMSAKKESGLFIVPSPDKTELL